MAKAKKARKETVTERRLIGLMPHPNSNHHKAGDYIVPLYEVHFYWVDEVDGKKVRHFDIKLEQGAPCYLSSVGNGLNDMEYLAGKVFCDVHERLAGTLAKFFIRRDKKVVAHLPNRLG